MVVIARNEKADSEDEFIGMMNTLLSLEKTYEEKRGRLGTVNEEDIRKVAGITREELEKIKAESL